ncbi:hypothetical protein [Moorena sp. SIO3I6]|uniref:hypothetical protein n=1 Tax=Moorena sp. SIO3I6 TaxID=2607831 RepID=UPI0025EF5BDC|nr:hypothetical protein [Moorena sp. SIO3I6]
MIYSALHYRESGVGSRESGVGSRESGDRVCFIAILYAMRYKGIPLNPPYQGGL